MLTYTQQYFIDNRHNVVDIETVLINRDLLFTYYYNTGDILITDLYDYWNLESNNRKAV